MRLFLITSCSPLQGLALGSRHMGPKLRERENVPKSLRNSICVISQSVSIILKNTTRLIPNNYISCRFLDCLLSLANGYLWNRPYPDLLCLFRAIIHNGPDCSCSWRPAFSSPLLPVSETPHDKGDWPQQGRGPVRRC